LAHRLDLLAERDAKVAAETEQVAAARRQGAMALHSVCAEFTRRLNAEMTRAEMMLVPTGFDPGNYREDVPNLIQMSLRGRIVQVQYEAPPQTLSSENFRHPYILQGSVHGFNQSLLDRDLIEEQSLFYARTGKKDGFKWHYFEPRTYRTGLVDEAYFTGLLNRLA
jgi:hypothetical protein